MLSMCLKLEFLIHISICIKCVWEKCIQLETNTMLLNKKIPSLTLQLLTSENAIKHNIINMENPMVIHLDYSDKDQTLSVSTNKINKRMLQNQEWD